MKNFNVTSMLVMLMFMCITSMQAQSITPSKKYITKELNNVSNFSSIRVLGSPDVEYRQSSDSKTTVSIYGSDNLVDLLEVSTVNGVLQVNIKKGVKILSGERRLKVIASSPSLDDVDIKESELCRIIKNDHSKQVSMWKDNVISFKDTPLTEVVKVLNRWYNVNFKIEDEQASKYVYTLTSDNTILEKVLQDLEKIAPVKFEYDEVRKEVTVRMKQDGKK